MNQTNGERTFQFSDTDGNWCKMTVSVSCDSDLDEREHLKGKKFWYVYYTYKYSDVRYIKARSCNPLYSLNDSTRYGSREKWVHDLDGGKKKIVGEHNLCIIYQNALSDILIRYLMMDFKALENLCGDDSPQEYKASVMWSIYALRM